MAKKKPKAHSVVDHLRGKFGDDSALTMGEGTARSLVRAVIPTGISVFDHYVAGCGGLPVGRITEVFSEEGTGKTSFVYAACAAVQRAGGIAIMVETEDSLSSERQTIMGVNQDDLVLIQPSHMEDALAQIHEAWKACIKYKAYPVLLAWDSLAATATKAEVEEGLIGKAAVADRARLMSRACRMFTRLAQKANATVLVVNQIRDNIGVMYGDNTTTPGGRSVKFHASLRIRLYDGSSFKDGVEHSGKTVTFSAIKNRFAPPYRKAKIRLDYFSGWNEQWSTLEHAKELKLVPESARSKASYDEALALLNSGGWSRRDQKISSKKGDTGDDE